MIQNILSHFNTHDLRSFTTSFFVALAEKQDVEDLNVFDVLLADSAYSKTSFDEESGFENLRVINSSFDLNSTILDTAALKGINVKQGRVYTSEAFYSDKKDHTEVINEGCKAVEMEAYALFYNAKKFKKKATALITISDSFVTHEEMDSQTREQKLDEMISIMPMGSIFSVKRRSMIIIVQRQNTNIAHSQPPSFL